MVCLSRLIPVIRLTTIRTIIQFRSLILILGLFISRNIVLIKTTTILMSPVEAELWVYDSIEHNLHVSNAVCISNFAYENAIVLFILDALLIYPVDINLSSLIYFSDRFNYICMVLCLFQNKDKFNVIWEVFIFLFLNEIFICVMNGRVMDGRVMNDRVKNGRSTARRVAASPGPVPIARRHRSPGAAASPPAAATSALAARVRERFSLEAMTAGVDAAYRTALQRAG